MAVAKKGSKTGRTVKSAAKKVAKAVDRNVIEPVAHLLGAKSGSRKKSSSSKGSKSSSRAKQSKKSSASEQSKR